MKAFYRIGEVAALLEEPPHVLRFWEQEFKVSVARSKRGQRVYSREQLVRFGLIRTLLREEGYTIDGARKVLRRAIRALRTPSPRALPVADASAPTAVPRAGEESRCETHATSPYTQNPAEFGCETLPMAADVQRESDALSRVGRLTEAERTP